MAKPSTKQAMAFEQALRHLTVGIRKGMIKQIKDEFGFEFADFPVLYLIDLGYTSPTEIKNKIMMSASTVSMMIDRGIKAGLIVRELDEQDSRRFVLFLTKDGQRLLHKLNEHYLQRIQKSGLSGKELEQLSVQLSQLATVFETLED